MIWPIITMLISPVLLPYRIAIYALFTFPLSIIKRGVALLGIEINTSLLGEFAIILYQYTAVAFTFGVALGILNLLVFYIIGEMFNWFETILRVDTKKLWPTQFAGKAVEKKAIRSTDVNLATPVLLPSTFEIPKKLSEQKAINIVEMPVLVKETQQTKKFKQLSLHNNTNISRKRTTNNNNRKKMIHNPDAVQVLTSDSADTTIQTADEALFTDSNTPPPSPSEITEYTENIRK